MPSEEMVERVARAICEQRMRERSIPLEEIDSALIAVCIPMARAALAAMPQPVGYTMTWVSHGERHYYHDENDVERAHRYLKLDPGCQATVVALVPVGGDDA